MKIGDKVKVKSKYFNLFNDLEGFIEKVDDWGDNNFLVRFQSTENLQMFNKTELKKVK